VSNNAHEVHERLVSAGWQPQLTEDVYNPGSPNEVRFESKRVRLYAHPTDRLAVYLRLIGKDEGELSLGVPPAMYPQRSFPDFDSMDAFLRSGRKLK